MSRSGYIDDCENDWAMICYRGAVRSAIRGKRGQSFLREMLAALDALPEKKLITEELVDPSGVCAMGAVIKMRGIDVSEIDAYEAEAVAGKLGIATSLAREIASVNDEHYAPETDEQRFARVRAWVARQISIGEPEK